jgi:hypothetical protein
MRTDFTIFSGISRSYRFSNYFIFIPECACYLNGFPTTGIKVTIRKYSKKVTTRVTIVVICIGTLEKQIRIPGRMAPMFAYNGVFEGKIKVFLK